MDRNTTSAESTTTPTPPPRPPLVRPRQGRLLAGVAAGLARNMEISTGLVRLVFLLSSLLGGMGIALYLAAWVLIRSEDQDRSPAQRLLANLGSAPSWIGIALVVLAGVLVLDRLTVLSGSMLWATVLVVVGVLLYRGDIDLSRPRRDRPAPETPTSTPQAVGEEAGSAPPPAPQ
ncbi:MAG TPA: PspC domain-containing protein, partial [Longimicrobiales bacterium]|nr:PspC domain-containing protein [Longimicrobiales bacterium]